MQVTAKDCNCDGTSLGLINQLWTMACLGLGLIGFIGAFLITGVPALFAALKANRCTACCKPSGNKCCNNNAVCYGVFAGLFCPLFLLMGGGFLAIGAATQSQEVKKLLESCQSEMGKAMKGDSSANSDADAMGAQVAACGAGAFCDGFSVIINDLGKRCLTIGVPFWIAGITMFFSCYACCCCAGTLPKKDSEVHADNVVAFQQSGK